MCAAKVNNDTSKINIDLSTLELKSEKYRKELDKLKDKFKKDFGMNYEDPDQDKKLENLAKKIANQTAYKVAQEKVLGELERRLDIHYDNE
jgi:chaperonin cofactor prefoldin